MSNTNPLRSPAGNSFLRNSPIRLVNNKDNGAQLKQETNRNDKTLIANLFKRQKSLQESKIFEIQSKFALQQIRLDAAQGQLRMFLNASRESQLSSSRAKCNLIDMQDIIQNDYADICEALKGELAIAEKRISQQCLEINNLRNKAEINLKESEVHATSLENKLRASETETAALKDSHAFTLEIIRTLKDEKNSLESKCNASQNEIASLKKSLDESLNSYDEIIRRRSETDELINKLEEENSRLTTALSSQLVVTPPTTTITPIPIPSTIPDDKTEKLKAAEARLSSIWDRLKETETRLRDTQSSHISMEEELRQSKLNIQDKDIRIKEQDTRMIDMKLQLKMLEADLIATTKISSERKRNENSNESRTSTVTSTSTSEYNSHDNNTSRISVLEASLREMEMLLNERNNKLILCQEQLLETKTQLTRSQSAGKLSQSQLDSLRQGLHGAGKTAGATGVNDVSDRLRVAESRLRDAEDCIRNRETQVEDRETLIHELEKNVRNNESIVTALQNQLNNVNAILREKDVCVSAAELRIKALETELTTSNDKCSVLKNKLQSTEEKLSDAVLADQMTRKDRIALKAEIIQLGLSLEQSQSQIGDSSSQLRKQLNDEQALRFDIEHMANQARHEYEQHIVAHEQKLKAMNGRLMESELRLEEMSVYSEERESELKLKLKLTETELLESKGIVTSMTAEAENLRMRVERAETSIATGTGIGVGTGGIGAVKGKGTGTGILPPPQVIPKSIRNVGVQVRISDKEKDIDRADAHDRNRDRVNVQEHIHAMASLKESLEKCIKEYDREKKLRQEAEAMIRRLQQDQQEQQQQQSLQSSTVIAMGKYSRTDSEMLRDTEIALEESEKQLIMLEASQEDQLAQIISLTEQLDLAKAQLTAAEARLETLSSQNTNRDKDNSIHIVSLENTLRKKQSECNELEQRLDRATQRLIDLELSQTQAETEEQMQELSLKLLTAETRLMEAEAALKDTKKKLKVAECSLTMAPGAKEYEQRIETLRLSVFSKEELLQDSLKELSAVKSHLATAMNKESELSRELETLQKQQRQHQRETSIDDTATSIIETAISTSTITTAAAAAATIMDLERELLEKTRSLGEMELRVSRVELQLEQEKKWRRMAEEMTRHVEEERRKLAARLPS
eukprot:gene1835-3549_t